MLRARGRHVAVFVAGLLAMQSPVRADLEQDCAQFKHVELKITACSVLIDRRSRLGWAYAGRAAAYLDKGDFARALEDGAKALAIDPQQNEAIAVRGMAYHLKGAQTDAIAEFTRLISITGLGIAYVYRSMPLQESGSFDRALADLDIALRLDARNAAAYMRRGEVHRAMSAMAPALADYGRSIELVPDDPEPHVGRCLTYASLGDHQRAVADCRTALQRQARSYTERRAHVTARETLNRLEGSDRARVETPVWRDVPRQSNF